MRIYQVVSDKFVPHGSFSLGNEYKLFQTRVVCDDISLKWGAGIGKNGGDIYDDGIYIHVTLSLEDGSKTVLVMSKPEDVRIFYVDDNAREQLNKNREE